MTPLKAFLSALIAAAALLFASVSQANVSCTIGGSILLDSSDSYYCDTGVLGTTACSGWREKDLDSTRVPLGFMEVCVMSGLAPSCTISNASGNWSRTVTLSGSQCAGQELEVRYYFSRGNENDVAAG